LLDAVAGLRPILEGEIEVGGATLFSSWRGINLAPRHRGIGYVPQEGALFPHLSVRKNILFGATRESDGRFTHINIQHVLHVLEIAHLLDRPVTKLSGGEAQRAALARAVLSNPQLLLLDEPLAALDVGLKERILPYLARVRDEFAIPMIYVTHNLTEVLTLANWVLILKQGKLVGQGIPQQILRSSSAVAVTGEDQFENVFTATILETDHAAGRTRVRFPSGLEVFVPLASESAGALVKIRISPDDILLGITAPEGISATNIAPGRITAVEDRAGEVLVTVNAGDNFYVRVTRPAAARLALAEQMPVFLIMKTRSFRFI
jgi:molybdate transport system ATP-binding protein